MKVDQAIAMSHRSIDTDYKSKIKARTGVNLHRHSDADRSLTSQRVRTAQGKSRNTNNNSFSKSKQSQLDQSLDLKSSLPVMSHNNDSRFDENAFAQNTFRSNAPLSDRQTEKMTDRNIGNISEYEVSPMLSHRGTTKPVKDTSSQIMTQSMVSMNKPLKHALFANNQPQKIEIKNDS